MATTRNKQTKKKGYDLDQGDLKPGESFFKKEKVNHPQHYGGDTTYEAIKVIEAWKLDFPLGNTVKYISRAGRKDLNKEIEDLEKAKWYLERKIQQLIELEKSHH